MHSFQNIYMKSYREIGLFGFNFVLYLKTYIPLHPLQKDNVRSICFMLPMYQLRLDLNPLILQTTLTQLLRMSSGNLCPLLCKSYGFRATIRALWLRLNYSLSLMTILFQSEATKLT